MTNPIPNDETSACADIAAGKPNATERRYYLYGKHSTQRRFRPMNLREGSRVVNLIFASRLTAADVQRFMREEAPRNTAWTFEPRPIRMSRARTH